MKNTRFTVQETLKKISNDNKERYKAILENENIEVGMYAFIKDDLQSPHLKDEIYVIVNGEGKFINDSKREAFRPGDLFLVCVGAENQFENLSDDRLPSI
jgi:mannose-6-phosphate isomerase-like protein (cupin superfamily)